MDFKILPEAVNNDFLINFQKRIKDIENTFHIKISTRGNKIMYQGDSRAKNRFKHFLENMLEVNREHLHISEHDLNIGLSMVREDMTGQIKDEMLRESVCIKINGKEVHPKTIKQKNI